MKAFKFLLIASAVVVMTGCKLVVAVGEGGSVQSGSGGNDCSGNSLCEIDINDATFSDTFIAVPAVGFVFSSWEEGSGFLCGNTTSATCSVDNTALAGNATAEAVIATDRAFAIRPIFEPVSGYLGMTSGSYDGSVLISGWTAACQAEYGGKAVMCDTKQVFSTPSLSAVVPPGSGMWIKPFSTGGSDSGTSSWRGLADYSGNNLQLNRAYCIGANPVYRGAILNPDFSLSVATCDVARPVACCR